MRSDLTPAQTRGRGHLRVLEGGKPEACQQLQDLLSGYAEGTLPATEAAAVGAHLGDCPACMADVRAFRAILAELRTQAALDRPVKDAGFWQELHQRIVAEVAAQPVARRWWQRPALRWGALAAAAALLAVLGLPRLIGGDLPAAEEARDNRAVFGTASELVRSDRGFVDDLAGSDGDPAQTLDELDDWEEIDLDALGTALDDQPEGEQGA